MPGPGTWQPGDILTADDLNAIGVWNSYTPVLTQNVARTATINQANYVAVNKMCMVNVDLTCTTTGSANTITVSLPLTSTTTNATFPYFGEALFFDSSANTVTLLSAIRASSTSIQFHANSTNAALNTTLGNGDVISFSLVYETV